MRRFCGIYVLYVKFDSQKTQKSQFGYWRPGVRISRQKIDKLACQAKDADIFAHGEYLHTESPCGSLFLFLPVWVMRTSLCEAERSIAARGGVCNNYTYCTNCNYLLLAWQDTASGMRIPNEAVGRLAFRRRMQVLFILQTIAKNHRICYNWVIKYFKIF